MRTTRIMLWGILCCASALGWIASPLAAAGAGEAPANVWVKACDGPAGERTGAVLLHAPELGKMLLLGGEAKGAPYVQAFDPAKRSWGELSAATPPAKRGIHPYYQSAYDAKDRRVYCFSDGEMFTFDLAGEKWQARGTPAALEGLSWHTAALDAEGRKLVVVGSDKKLGNIGWTRTAVLDLASGAWTTLPPPPEPLARKHEQLVAAREAIIDLVGRTRLAWYRDPKGVGTDAERKALAERCADLKKMPEMAAFAAQVDAAAALIEQPDLLGALKSARDLQRQVEVLREAEYPVPCSRRNSPLAFDRGNKVFVLFGGDHEDYQLNDTWVLDLAKGSWRRAAPAAAPSPRAGGALVYLRKCGRLALYGGYVASSNPDYRSHPWSPAGLGELWLYDVSADRWQRAAAAPQDAGSKAAPAAPLAPRAAGGFYGYSAQWYSPPALAADESDRLVMAFPGDGKSPASTWVLQVDAAAAAAPEGTLAAEPNQRLYRTGRFLASYCEVPHPDRPSPLDALGPNRWVKLPAPQRNVAYGCRQRDWGTSVWDSANQQILLWGGGHCDRSASTVIHYSPVSAQMVEGYDADEPYGYNGGGGFGSSLWNRPWVPVHGYNLYAYDPKCGLVVTATGFLYDPARMDWLRIEPVKRPFQFQWGHTVIETSPHGAVAWAQYPDSERIGLWLFDRDRGWEDLKPQGKLYRPYCDSEGMVYDSKRDRMILGWGGGYDKKGDGTVTTFDFKTRRLEKITPGRAELGQLRDTREMVYAAHGDCVLFGSSPFVQGEGKAAKQFTVVYDCAKSRYALLDAGEVAYGHSAGWVYDEQRKLIYVLTNVGAAYALKLDPATAKLLDAP